MLRLGWIFQARRSLSRSSSMITSCTYFLFIFLFPPTRSSAQHGSNRCLRLRITRSFKLRYIRSIPSSISLIVALALFLAFCRGKCSRPYETNPARKDVLCHAHQSFLSDASRKKVLEKKEIIANENRVGVARKQEYSAGLMPAAVFFRREKGV